MSTVQVVISGFKIDDISEGTGDWGLCLSLCCSALTGTTAIVARVLNQLGVKLRSRLG